jgi:hypothetical protein
LDKTLLLINSVAVQTMDLNNLFNYILEEILIKLGSNLLSSESILTLAQTTPIIRSILTSNKKYIKWKPTKCQCDWCTKIYKITRTEDAYFSFLSQFFSENLPCRLYSDGEINVDPRTIDPTTLSYDRMCKTYHEGYPVVWIYTFQTKRKNLYVEIQQAEFRFDEIRVPQVNHCLKYTDLREPDEKIVQFKFAEHIQELFLIDSEFTIKRPEFTNLYNLRLCGETHYINVQLKFLPSTLTNLTIYNGILHGDFPVKCQIKHLVLVWSITYGSNICFDTENHVSNKLILPLSLETFVGPNRFSTKFILPQYLKCFAHDISESSFSSIARRTLSLPPNLEIYVQFCSFEKISTRDNHTNDKYIYHHTKTFFEFVENRYILGLDFNRHTVNIFLNSGLNPNFLTKFYGILPKSIRILHLLSHLSDIQDLPNLETLYTCAKVEFHSDFVFYDSLQQILNWNMPRLSTLSVVTIPIYGLIQRERRLKFIFEDFEKKYPNGLTQFYLWTHLQDLMNNKSIPFVPNAKNISLVLYQISPKTDKQLASPETRFAVRVKGDLGIFRWKYGEVSVYTKCDTTEIVEKLVMQTLINFDKILAPNQIIKVTNNGKRDLFTIFRCESKCHGIPAYNEIRRY